MGTHMKTTIEISDPLLAAAKAAAARTGTTLRAIVEEGLRAVLAGRDARRRVKPRDATFKGRGLHPEFVARGGWRTLRDAAYDDDVR